MKKIDVDIAVCLSTNKKIEVPDDFEYDPENPEILMEYVREQVDFPQDEFGYEDWYVDEFCVM